NPRDALDDEVQHRRRGETDEEMQRAAEQHHPVVAESAVLPYQTARDAFPGIGPETAIQRPLDRSEQKVCESGDEATEQDQAPRFVVSHAGNIRPRVAHAPAAAQMSRMRVWQRNE